MSIIYQPKGKAREYSPLSANLYTGCNHLCSYCYCPSILRFQKNCDYTIPTPKRNVLQEVENDCKKYYNSKDQVLLCFMTDPYNNKEQELRITRDTIKLFIKYKIPFSILTKAGKKSLADIDLLKKAGEHCLYGATLVFSQDSDRLKHESGAAKTNERVKALKTAKENGIKTWASFEPMFYKNQSLDIIKKTIELDCVDMYKLGKLNNFSGHKVSLDENISFLHEAVNILRDAKKEIYVKDDLAAVDPYFKFKNTEREADAHQAKPYLK